VSARNLQLHRRALQALTARDIDALLAFIDPQIEFYTEMAEVGGGVYHGHDGMRQWIGDLQDAWGNEFRAEPEAFFDLGEQTLLCYLLRARGRYSGAGVAKPLVQVCRWRDGLCVYSKVYVHREDAFGDLGVSERELEPIVP
jgi:ketosteroid isomerase-like protein